MKFEKFMKFEKKTHDRNVHAFEKVHEFKK